MNSYALLDCGDGRRLERLGGVTVSRPAPAAAFPRNLSREWLDADLSFDRETGWTGNPPPEWRATLGGITLGLRPAAGGQIGVFPEHAAVCDSLAHLLTGAGPETRALNLFAHTGQATLRLASLPGLETTHVDAAPAAVKQARENAVLSGLSDRPVRWLVDDALGFLRREARRGALYDCIVADPPAYGRSKKGGEWKLERDLPELLDLVRRLLKKDALLCLTCHREGWTADDVARKVRETLPEAKGVNPTALALRSAVGGHSLAAGFLVTARLQ